MPKIEKAARRDKQSKKQRQGMQVTGKSVFLLARLGVQEKPRAPRV